MARIITPLFLFIYNLLYLNLIHLFPISCLSSTIIVFAYLLIVTLFHLLTLLLSTLVSPPLLRHLPTHLSTLVSPHLLTHLLTLLSPLLSALLFILSSWSNISNTWDSFEDLELLLWCIFKVSEIFIGLPCGLLDWIAFPFDSIKCSWMNEDVPCLVIYF